MKYKPKHSGGKGWTCYFTLQMENIIVSVCVLTAATSKMDLQAKLCQDLGGTSDKSNPLALTE